MNLETGTGVAQFPEKENINGIFVAVYRLSESVVKILRDSSWQLLILPYSLTELYLLVCAEPVFFNVYGAHESIPRNEFRRPM